VRVRSYLAPADGSRCVLSIEDTGFGMTEPDLREANDLLTSPPDFDIRGRTLGFQVVGRLARRYGVGVRLATTPGGGVTALVMLPESLVTERALEPARALPERSVRDAATDRPAVGPGQRDRFGEPDDLDDLDDVDLDDFDLEEDDGFDDFDLDLGLAPDPAPMPGAPVTAGGLVRRVPGAGLSPTLHQAGRGPGARSAAERRPRRTRQVNPAERERMRSMLSRFQAGLRAGRAISTAPVGSLARRPGHQAEPLVPQEGV